MIAARIVQALPPITAEANTLAARTAARNPIAATLTQAAAIAVRRSRRVPAAHSRAGRKSAEILFRCC